MSTPRQNEDDAPLRVSIVPPEDPTLTKEQRKSAEASIAPEAIENRDKSYLPPVEGINMNVDHENEGPGGEDGELDKPDNTLPEEPLPGKPPEPPLGGEGRKR